MDKAELIFNKLAAFSKSPIARYTDVLMIGNPMKRKIEMKRLLSEFPELEGLGKMFTGKPSPGTIYRKGKRAIRIPIETMKKII